MKKFCVCLYKKLIPGLLLFFLCTPGYSQPGTNLEKLQQLSVQFRQRFENGKKNATDYATKANIPLRKEFPSEKVIELMGVENGRLLYYETHNSNASKATRADRLWPGGGLGLSLDGTGYNGLGEWDAGAVLSTHQEFTNNGPSRVTQVDGATTTHYHATHVAGTLIGAGLGNISNGTSKGMAYNGNLKAYDWNYDESEMASAGGNGLEISNHSYGFIHGWDGTVWYGSPSISNDEDYWFGFYSSYTQDFDIIAYNAPYYLIVKSAGNDRNDFGDGSHPPDGYPDGYDCIGTRGIAKNILTVGAVNDVTSYTGPGSVTMSSFSSWGPADDGRIKPDIVGNGVGLFSAYNSNNSSYASLSGTSMSSPNVAGTLALLQQHYQNTHNGESMRAATLKALVIHTADEAGPDPGPDYMFGWGLMNAEKAARTISEDGNGNSIIDELVLNNGGSFSLDIQADGTEPLVVSIVWTDPPHDPLPAALDPITPHVINDLDLRVTNGSTTFYPYKLNRDNPSAAATSNSENNVDNVELVYVANPAPGNYTIHVDHDGTLADPQHYSLVVTGGAPAVEAVTVKYAIIGDYGSGTTNETAVANMVKGWNPGFVVTTGDNRYNGLTLDEAVGKDYCPFLKDVQSGTYCPGGTSPLNAFFPSTGNHDYSETGNIARHLDYFNLPGTGIQTTNTSGSELYYDFIQGPIHFFVIDSYDAIGNPVSMTAQKNWLQTQMAASASIWKVVYFHHPPYSSGVSHGSTPAMQWPFAQWGADAVLNGHDHTYERILRDGIVYFVNGIGGHTKYNFGTPVVGSIVRYNNTYGAQLVEADDNAMTFSFINIDGQTIDRYTIYKNPPPNDPPAFTQDIITKPDAQAGSSYSSSLSGDATDPDSDPLVFSKVSGPAWLSVLADGSLSGTPGNSDIGLNSFTVGVSDNKGGSDQAELRINVTAAPQPPPSGTVEIRISGPEDDVEQKISGPMYFDSSDIELGNDPAYNGDQVEGLLFRNIYVPHGATITNAWIEFETDETGSDPAVVNIKAHDVDDAPSFVNINNNITSRVTTTSFVTWNIPAWNTVNEKHQTPDISSVIQELIDREGWIHNNKIAIIINGSGTRTAEAYEGEPTAAALLHIEYETIVNNPPLFTTDPVIEINAVEDATYSSTLTDNASDPDGDPLTYSRISGPAWLTVSSDGTISGTPANEDVGTQSWTVQVSDGNGGSDQAVLQITVLNTNDDPVFDSNPIVGQNANEGEPYAGSIAGKASDPDGDPLIFTKISGPDWLTMDSGGALSGIPVNENVGTNTWTIQVNDGNGGYAQTELQITVIDINQPPLFTSDPVIELNATEDATYSSTLADDASDPDGDPLTYSKISGLAWLTVSPDGSLSGIPSNEDVGTQSWTVQVSDGNGGSDQAIMEIRVVNTNDPPEFIADPLVKQNAYVGIGYSGSISADAGDIDGDNLSFTKISGPSWLLVYPDGTLTGSPGTGDAGLNEFVVGVSDGNGGSDQAALRISVINASYCSSKGTSSSQEWIEQVSFNGIFRTTGNNGGNGDFTSSVAYSFDQSGTVSFILSPGFSGKSSFQYWAVWIDSNHDFDFDDAGELIYVSSKSKIPVSGSFTVAGLPGETRMRIAMSDAGTPQSCGDFSGGEVEDYKVNIIPQIVLQPVADFTADATTIVVGGTVHFTDLSLNNPTSWLWDFGDGQASTLRNPSVIYNSAGTYTVSLTATNSSGSDTETRVAYITVNEGVTEPPVADFSANPTSITAGETVNFSDLSTNLPQTWLWDFGDGSTSSLQHPSHTFYLAGNFTVSLTVTNDAGSDNEVKPDFVTVTQPPAPVAQFTADKTTVVVDETIHFTDLSSNNPGSWSWDFGDGQTSILQHPSVAYNVAGQYTVTLIATNFTGSGTEIKTNYITVTDNPGVQYCEPVLINNSVVYINSFTIDGISGTTGRGTSGYMFYTSPQIGLSPGQVAPVNLVPNSNTSRNFWRIWIDFNVDGDFDDSDETLLVANNKRGTVTGAISIPSYASGTTRIRISLKAGNSQASCEDGFSGEVEDYLVNFGGTTQSEVPKSATLQPSGKEPDFKVFPNPASDRLYIELIRWEEKPELRLMEITGKTVLVRSGSENWVELDVSGLAGGLYLISVTGNNYRQQKVIGIH